MDHWIIQKNIERFEQMVPTLADPTKRQTVETLLLRERRKLAAMESEAEAHSLSGATEVEGEWAVLGLSTSSHQADPPRLQAR